MAPMGLRSRPAHRPCCDLRFPAAPSLSRGPGDGGDQGRALGSLADHLLPPLDGFGGGTDRLAQAIGDHGLEAGEKGRGAGQLNKRLSRAGRISSSDRLIVGVSRGQLFRITAMSFIADVKSTNERRFLETVFRPSRNRDALAVCLRAQAAIRHVVDAVGISLRLLSDDEPRRFRARSRIGCEISGQGNETRFWQNYAAHQPSP